MSLVTDEIRASASEYYQGNEVCQEKSKDLLKEVNLPNGLLPMDDMEECGFVRETGFVWLKSKKKTEHKFEKINKLVHFAPEVTAYVEPNRIKKLTGVKAKELLIWVALSEIYVGEPSTGNIHFKIPAGLSRSYPFDAFVVEEPIKKDDDHEKKKAAASGFDAVDDAAAAKTKVDREETKGSAVAVEVKEV